MQKNGFKKIIQTASMGYKKQQILEELKKQQTLDFLQYCDENGDSLIHLAVYNNQIQVLKQYIKFICSNSVQYIRQPMEDSQRQQKYINQKTQFKIMKYINLGNKNGVTPIHYAAFQGNIQIIQYLESLGAKIYKTTHQELNIMHFACQNNQIQVFRYFYGKIDLNKPDKNGYSVLHWACYSNSIDIVEFLISKHQQLDVQDKQKNTPLHIAALYNHKQIVKLLLQAGANISCKNSQEKNPQQITTSERIKIILSSWDPHKNKKRKKRNKCFTVALFLLFEFIFIATIVCQFLIYGMKSFYYLLSISTILVIISLLVFFLFMHLIQIINIHDYQSQILFQNDFISDRCYYCDLPKQPTKRHCHICEQCKTLPFKHYWLTDSCIDLSNIWSYIIFFIMMTCLLLICNICGTYFFIDSYGKIKQFQWYICLIAGIDIILIIPFCLFFLDLFILVSYYFQTYQQYKYDSSVVKMNRKNQGNTTGIFQKIRDRKRYRHQKIVKQMQKRLLEKQNY